MKGLGLGLGFSPVAAGGAAPPAVPSSYQFNGIDEVLDIFPNTIGSNVSIGWTLSLWLKLPTPLLASGKIVYGESGNSHNMAVNAAATPYPMRRRLAGASVTLTTNIVANVWSHLIWRSNCSLSYPVWAISTAYSVGDIRKANSNFYVCTQAGTSAGSGTGPSGTGTNIVDNTVRWDFRNSQLLSFFINGIAQGTSTANATFFFDNFGSRGAFSNFFPGQLCEATVWGEALPDAICTGLYNGGVFVDPMDVAFNPYNRLNHWRMGLGDSSPTILDLVGSKPLAMMNGDNSNFVPDHP